MLHLMIFKMPKALQTRLQTRPTLQRYPPQPLSPLPQRQTHLQPPLRHYPLQRLPEQRSRLLSLRVFLKM
jgi:hypothetical protein